MNAPKPTTTVTLVALRTEDGYSAKCPFCESVALVLRSSGSDQACSHIHTARRVSPSYAEITFGRND